MSLLRHKHFLFLDGQTTGMRPPSAQLIELAWCVACAETGINAHEPLSRLTPLPEGLSIPQRVTEITGLKSEDLADSSPLSDTAQILWQNLFSLSEPALLIHYAQFERPFLLDLWARHPGREDTTWPFPILCTQQILKRLFPDIPSLNIRAAAGFFGPAIIGPNRAGPHVRATLQIWQGLVPELEKRGIHSLTDLHTWLESTAPKSQRKKASVSTSSGPVKKYAYRLQRLKRLSLPEGPGVYRMLDQSGQVLYVGKATSLRARVNSYFRGFKGRDRQKLSLLAQVWDLQITECATPLEAALLESDEIKRLDPPYNIALKAGRRHLVFYNRDFSECTRQQTPTHWIGPFRPNGWLETLRALWRSLTADEFEPIFFTPLPQEDLRAGFELFCQEQGLASSSFRSLRQILALASHLYRRLGVPIPSSSLTSTSESTSTSASNESPSDEESTDVISVEEIAGKFQRLFRRAGAELRRARRMNRLLNARVQLGERELIFKNGQLASATKEWAGWEIATYDRLSIVLSEITRAKGEAHSFTE